jgi:hypothetical protein
MSNNDNRRGRGRGRGRRRAPRERDEEAVEVPERQEQDPAPVLITANSELHPSVQALLANGAPVRRQYVNFLVQLSDQIAVARHLRQELRPVPNLARGARPMTHPVCHVERRMLRALMLTLIANMVVALDPLNPAVEAERAAVCPVLDVNGSGFARWPVGSAVIHDEHIEAGRHSNYLTARRPGHVEIHPIWHNHDPGATWYWYQCPNIATMPQHWGIAIHAESAVIYPEHVIRGCPNLDGLCSYVNRPNVNGFIYGGFMHHVETRYDPWDFYRHAEDVPASAEVSVAHSEHPGLVRIHLRGGDERVVTVSDLGFLRDRNAVWHDHATHCAMSWRLVEHLGASRIWVFSKTPYNPNFSNLMDFPRRPTTMITGPQASVHAGSIIPAVADIEDIVRNTIPAHPALAAFRDDVIPLELYRDACAYLVGHPRVPATLALITRWVRQQIQSDSTRYNLTAGQREYAMTHLPQLAYSNIREAAVVNRRVRQGQAVGFWQRLTLALETPVWGNSTTVAEFMLQMRDSWMPVGPTLAFVVVVLCLTVGIFSALVFLRTWFCVPTYAQLLLPDHLVVALGHRPSGWYCGSVGPRLWSWHSRSFLAFLLQPVSREHTWWDWFSDGLVYGFEFSWWFLVWLAVAFGLLAGARCFWRSHTTPAPPTPLPTIVPVAAAPVAQLGPLPPNVAPALVPVPACCLGNSRVIVADTLRLLFWVFRLLWACVIIPVVEENLKKSFWTIFFLLPLVEAYARIRLSQPWASALLMHCAVGFLDLQTAIWVHGTWNLFCVAYASGSAIPGGVFLPWRPMPRPLAATGDLPPGMLAHLLYPPFPQALPRSSTPCYLVHRGFEYLRVEYAHGNRRELMPIPSRLTINRIADTIPPSRPVRVIGPCLGVLPVVFSGSSHNILAALTKRHVVAFAESEQATEFLERFVMLALDIMYPNDRPTAALSIVEYLAGYPRGVRLQILAELDDPSSTWYRGKGALQMFVKQELALGKENKTLRPRLIVSFPVRQTAFVNRIGQAISHYQAACWDGSDNQPLYLSGKTPRQIAAVLLQLSNKYDDPNFARSDCSAWDANVSPAQQRIVERVALVLSSNIVDEHIDHFRQSCHDGNPKRVRVIGKGISVTIKDPQMLSGKWLTSFGNTTLHVHGLYCVWVLAHLLGMGYEDPDDEHLLWSLCWVRENVTVFVMGDDLVRVCSSQHAILFDPRRLAAYGWKSEPTFYTSIDKLPVCSATIIPAQTCRGELCHTMTPRVGVLLAKFGVDKNQMDIQTTPAGYMRANALGLLLMGGANPLLRAFATRILSLTEGAVITAADRARVLLETRHHVTQDTEALFPTSDTFVVLASKYDLTVNDVEDLTDYLANLPQLDVVLVHPVLDHIYLVENASL